MDFLRPNRRVQRPESWDLAKLVLRLMVQKFQGQPPFGWSQNPINHGISWFQLPTSAGEWTPDFDRHPPYHFHWETRGKTWLLMTSLHKWISDIETETGKTSEWRNWGDMCGLRGLSIRHTPWKFNSSPLKISHPKRKGPSSNHHFSGAMLNSGGCKLVRIGETQNDIHTN